MLKICITGHRTLGSPAYTRQSIAGAFEHFQKIDKKILAISSLAAGSDTVFAEEAIKKGIKLKVVLPFAVAEYKKDFDEMELRSFSSIVYNRKYETAFDLQEFDQENRNTAYLETGKSLVDQSDVVVAVWDQQPARGKGGTGDIVEYAKARNKQIYVIDSQKGFDANEAEQYARDLFVKLDGQAEVYKEKRFEPAWIMGIFFGFLAAVCFAGMLVLPIRKENHFYLSCIETVLIGISFYALAIYAKKWKKAFLVTRRDTEYLRIILQYKSAGIPIPEISESEYSPQAQILEIEKELSKGVTEIENLAKARNATNELVSDQITYHKKRIKRLGTRNHLAEWSSLGIKVLFFLVFFGKILMEAFHLPDYPEYQPLFSWLKFFQLVLPPAYAALEGISYFAEWKKNKEISVKMVTKLERVQKKLLGAADDIEFLMAAKDLRLILEWENSDWAQRVFWKEIEGKV
jgi:hypothetical protein